ncbi:hypothetical protein HMPREF9130_0034 [Peptoniphilus sp. oral taxon 375 str. F0436]|nr:hypothetical protein HMPREF9130_0034 [Peptoniphilus sp. oral taxon 375 str. F0436]
MSKVLDIINLEELLTKEVEISENKEDMNPGILLIKSIEISKAVNNKMFLKGALTDGNIDIDFKIWDYNGDGSEFLNSIRVFKGKLNTYNGNIQLIINKYKFEDVDVKLLPLKFNMEYISGKTKVEYLKYQLLLETDNREERYNIYDKLMKKVAPSVRNHPWGDFLFFYS